MNKNEIELAGAVAEGTATGLTKSFHDLVSKLGGPAAEQLGGAWGDHMFVWRLERAARLQKRVDAALGGRPVTNSVTPKVLVPALQQATLEDDDKLQDMWAHLLASAATTDRVQPYFVTVLSQLSATDVRLLDFLWDIRTAGNDGEPDVAHQRDWTTINDNNALDVCKIVGLPLTDEGRRQLGLALEHVCGLALVLPRNDNRAPQFQVVAYSLTIFGVSLLQVCRADES